uniref:Protein-S-isoprenylcysteine O-methyltransferase n=1 Tax=Tribolium castaneum TaxID=7070 RepID=UPI000C81095F|nr:Chain A, Protein-S-isoprenylcysteine O-methyltransferase [Tribolium castaneum]
MLSPAGKISLQSFTGSSLVFFVICMFNHYYGITNLVVNTLIVFFYAVNVYFFLKFFYNEFAFAIAIRAAFLGLVLVLGLYIKLVAPPNIQIFGGYMSVMALFHYSEFLAIAIVQPKQVSTDSFVINHSPQYTIAAVSSWVEFFIETYFFPALKAIHWLSNIGLCVCILGEVLRKTAILTAGSNFNHLVQCEKSSDHVLVTHGVYAWFRHPSYVGWFYWSIGTQIILINPLCIPAYTLASWMFFKERIYIEESMLLSFFGQQYCDYQQQVGTGIPFIEGYKIAAEGEEF